jgi:Zn-dependent protease with chaperone function
MELPARYQDGQTAITRDVWCRFEGQGDQTRLMLRDAFSGNYIDQWKGGDVFPVHARPKELKIGSTALSNGARLSFFGEQAETQVRMLLPALGRKHRLEAGRQFRLAAGATLALVSVIVAYIYGVPLLAGRIVPLIPSAWEARFGETIADQAKVAFADAGGEFTECDPDPNSVANRAIARFATAVMEGSNSPFTPHVDVIRSDILNAFALPGGQVYYFSALLEQSQSPDEFAGVLAHELGHVVHRHSMEQLVSTAGTGILIGFILGDLTGASVAAIIGDTLINSHFSRESELEADAYSASVARRLAFDPQGLPNLLDRVAGDDDATRALALLSTHPLTDDRRAALEALAIDQTGLEEPFTDAEWQAIRTMCGSPTNTNTQTPPDTERQQTTSAPPKQKGTR